MKTIGIFYICTGRYNIFWEGFFESSEKFFLAKSGYDKHYFVFTDASTLPYEDNHRVRKIYQEQLEWPHITLSRFKIFQKALPELSNVHYIYFFNANMVFVNHVGTEILPEMRQEYTFLLHPYFIDKPVEEYPYERNPRSLAYIPKEIGKYYFQGALNGGIAKSYLNMVNELRRRVDEDMTNDVMAVWHDESHLNKYAVEHEAEIKPLSPAYGYPEGWNLPFDKRIISLDKGKYGGHAFLRNQNVKRWYDVFSRRD